MPALLAVPLPMARRFQRRATLLDAPAPDVGMAVAHLGYVQIDPINVCGRMHDLILRHRVAGYREGDLVRHLHGAEDGRALAAARRSAFEHHLPQRDILVAFAVDAWPHLLTAMRQRSRTAGRWAGRLTPRERSLAERILADIAARGPLSSDDIADGRSSRAVWGSATLVKAVMQKLFFHGRLLIATRERHRRRYDLPERVLPAAVLALPEAPPEETQRWLALMALRQRRLVALRRSELAAVADVVQAVQVAGGPVLHCLRADLPLLLASGAEDASPAFAAPRLLAPLDPLIYDRKVTRAVWSFSYAWEAYTPAARRQRGHYAMPLLCGTELAGHVDPKADRAAGRLRVVSRSVRRGFRSAPAVNELASFLGLKA